MKLIRKASSKDGWYEVTPGDAQEILDRRANNRPIRERRASAIAEEIRIGRFAENGESLIFDDQGKLMDGQHRMRAIVLANKPIISFCVHDVPRKYFATIDDCSKRTGGDVLGIAGHQHAMVVASVARWIIKYDSGFSPSPGSAWVTIPNRMIVEITKKNNDITDAVTFILSLSEIKRIMPPSIASFCYLMAARHDHKKAQEFFTKLASGEQLETGNPILTLRNRFIDLAGQKHTALGVEKTAWIIKAWNAFVDGREMKIVRWFGRTRNEAFPRFGEAE